MKVATYEATVEVPDIEEVPRLVVRSPRLARPEQLQELVKEVSAIASAGRGFGRMDGITLFYPEDI